MGPSTEASARGLEHPAAQPVELKAARDEEGKGISAGRRRVSGGSMMGTV